MLRSIMRGLIACVLVFVAAEVSFAESCGSDAQTSASVAIKRENVGNQICPVSGENIGTGGMEPVTYEYEGKIYNFCCASCIDEFKKNPAKYIKIVEEEMKDN